MTATLHRRWVSGALAAACGAIALAAQDPAGQRPTFRTGTELVQLDVSVLDKNRRPVRGLTASDFTVLENGQPQPITVFSAVDVPDREVVETEWMRDVAPDVVTNQVDDRRIMAIVFDDWSVGESMASFRAAQASALRAIDELGPGDLAAVIFTLDNRYAQEFTMDRARLRRAIERQGLGFAPSTDGTFVGACDCGLCSIRAITDVSRVLQEISHRRKSIIYISTGVPINFGAASTDRCNSRQRAELDRAFQASALSNTTVYPVDPGGLRVGQGFNIATEYLQIMARNTGGSAIINDNFPDRIVPRIFVENGSYYLLGYELRGVKPEGDFFRRLEVRVNRPDMEVRSRERYYGPLAKTLEKVATLSPLDRALVKLLPTRDVALQALVAPFALAGTRPAPLFGPEPPGAPRPPARRNAPAPTAAAAIVLGIEQPLLRPDLPPHERITEEVQLLISAFDPEGRPRGAHRQDARVVLRPAAGGEVRYEVLTRVDLGPGQYQLRLVAHNASRAQTGSIHVDVEVPDFAREPVSMSGLILSAEPSRAAAPRDALVGLVPIVPTALRRFGQTDRVTVFGRVYQSRSPRDARPVSLTVRVVDTAEKAWVSKTESLPAGRFNADRAFDLQFSLPVQGLPAGEYLLTVEARLDSKRVVRRDVRFTVG